MTEEEEEEEEQDCLPLNSAGNKNKVWQQLRASHYSKTMEAT